MTRAKRPMIGAGAALLAAGALVSTFAGTASAATLQRSAPAAGTPYGGFTTEANATPLRIELYEPAIPLPASPQVELNFSYSKVTGTSGPDSTALASAMWPGASVGTGLPAILLNVGLPASLAKNNYPVQVNAQYPGTPNSGSQEFLPGMVGRVSGSAKEAVARAGYSTSGTVAGDPSSSSSVSGALSQLKSGNLSALEGLLSPQGSSSDTTSNPLGLLSAIISVGGMSSSSVTDYSDPTVVTATGTSQIGDIELLGGLVKLEGFTASSESSSSLDGGAKATQKVTYGGLTVSGQSYKLTSNGIEAAGKTTSTPDTSATAALAKLGISITLPKPTHTVSGTLVNAAASGPTITIDTQPIISLLQLNKLPLSGIVNKLPSSANQLKGLLLAALQAHPKIVLLLGDVASSAQTISAVSLGGGSLGGSLGGSTTSPSLGGTGVPTGTGVTTAPSAGTTPTTTTPLTKTSAVPGLPPLGSVPTLLILGGLIAALAIGWLFRAAALTALGASGTCTHGLATGLPDLRKA